MQNDAGQVVDLYLPRKCSASNRLIHSRDFASVQLDVADIDPETGLITGTAKTFAICGMIRRLGEADDSLSRLCREAKVMPSGHSGQQHGQQHGADK